MNTELYTEMWERFPGKSSPRMLMLAIARASDERGTCRCTTKELATSARMSRTNVWRLLGELEKSRWIEIEHPQMKSGPATIQLALARLQKQAEGPQAAIERYRCGGRRKAAPDRSQQEMIFPPVLVEPVPRLSASDCDRLVHERKLASSQPQYARSNNLLASRLGPFGKLKRW